MSVVRFPDPQSSKDSSARDVSDSWFDDDPEAGGSGKMSFLEHLDELRKRIVRALLALCVGVGIAAFFIEDLYAFVMLPLRQMLRPGETMIYTYPTEAFMLYIRIALIAGLFISAPLIFWQVWLFVAPALYAKERRYAIPFVVLSSIGVARGRGVLALRGVPADVAVLRELLERSRLVHAAHRRRVQRLHAHAARHGGRLSNAGAGVLPGADGGRHRALDDPPVQVRGAGDRGRRRDHHAELGRRQPADRRRPDGGALHPEHRHRVGVWEETSQRLRQG